MCVYVYMVNCVAEQSRTACAVFDTVMQVSHNSYSARHSLNVVDSGPSLISLSSVNYFTHFCSVHQHSHAFHCGGGASKDYEQNSEPNEIGVCACVSVSFGLF